MTLFEECLEVLGDDKSIISQDDKKKIEDMLYSNFKLTFYGRIDWDIIKYKRKVLLKDLNNESNDFYYIIWSDTTFPIIQCNLFTILRYIDDVTAVSSDLFLLSKDANKIIEFYHENEITIGYKN